MNINNKMRAITLTLAFMAIVLAWEGCAIHDLRLYVEETSLRPAFVMIDDFYMDEDDGVLIDGGTPKM